MICCLKIDPDLFPEILTPLIEALRNASEFRYNDESYALQNFYHLILKSEHFKELHIYSISQILKKEWNESEESFYIKSQTTPVKESLTYLLKIINSIKKQTNCTNSEQMDQLNDLLTTLDQLRNFTPYKQIYQFASVQWNEKKVKENPGLPFTYLGGGQISNFVSRALLSFDDYEKININDSECRKILLESAEQLLTYYFSNDLKPIAIDMNKIDDWLSKFPEIKTLACWPQVEKFLSQIKLS